METTLSPRRLEELVTTPVAHHECNPAIVDHDRHVHAEIAEASRVCRMRRIIAAGSFWRRDFLAQLFTKEQVGRRHLRHDDFSREKKNDKNGHTESHEMTVKQRYVFCWDASKMSRYG